MRKLVLVAVFVPLTFAFSANRHSPSSPEIVAHNAFVHRTAPFSRTIYTPATDGAYRISMYVEMFGANNNTNLSAFVLWTDGVGRITVTNTTNPPLACGFSGPTARCDVVGTLQVKANTRIKVDFLNVTVSQGGSYNAYVVLERLVNKR